MSKTSIVYLKRAEAWLDVAKGLIPSGIAVVTDNTYLGIFYVAVEESMINSVKSILCSWGEDVSKHDTLLPLLQQMYDKYSDDIWYKQVYEVAGYLDNMREIYSTGREFVDTEESEVKTYYDKARYLCKYASALEDNTSDDDNFQARVAKLLKDNNIDTPVGVIMDILPKRAHELDDKTLFGVIGIQMIMFNVVPHLSGEHPNVTINETYKM